MQHVEFFHREHFERRYHRQKAKKVLSQFIDFFWETDFDSLFLQHPLGFSDALFPNVGYTYLINLGTPFVMQLEEEKYEVRHDGFLPRHKYMICHHSAGNKIFGVKFNVSPVVFQKRINFSEYRDYIFPLAYLIDRNIIDSVRKASLFDERIKILSDYYEVIIRENAGLHKQVNVVTGILQDCIETNAFDVSIEDLSAQHRISSRTLQRYFEATTSISSKQALQILRIRKAVEKLTASPADFHYSLFGYYDYSHFYKHLKQFLNHQTITILQPHLQLLRRQTETN
ncbi:MAG TPA: AraC family transcriptional regulator [Flavisolibacter sp.]|nr:AraC family transcriptional regulator [Flavisolibacter sp.]